MHNPRFGYHFAQLHRLMLSLCKENIGGLGVQPSQMPFLVALLRVDKPITQDELSTALSIDKAATARAMEQLEKKGFVTRKINPHNRRQKLVSITTKALGIADQLFDVLQKTSKVFIKDFTRKEMTTMLTLINRMISNAMKEKNDRYR